jgi:hypothetical protein
MATTNKIMVGIDDQVIELKGEDLTAFETDREQMRVQSQLVEAEYKAKQDLRESAIRQLAQTANLTEEQITLLIQGI